MSTKNITIIGSADGPTSIYLASKFDPFELILIVIGVILVVAGLVTWRKIRKKKKS